MVVFVNESHSDVSRALLLRLAVINRFDVYHTTSVTLALRYVTRHGTSSVTLQFLSSLQHAGIRVNPKLRFFAAKGVRDECITVDIEVSSTHLEDGGSYRHSLVDRHLVLALVEDRWVVIEVTDDDVGHNIAVARRLSSVLGRDVEHVRVALLAVKFYSVSQVE